MNKINKLILRSYLGPFVLTFLVVMFILLMQFVWKYIDDFVGKGLEWSIMGELIFYVAATLVPMALPLAILLASIMTLGNLAESYELTALKSAGHSLQKVMKPLIVVTILMSVGAFIFSNNILPIANLKMGSLLYDITHQKPTLDIKEGIFYNGIQDYTIKVAKKDVKKNLLYDVMIYDHTQHNGCNKVVVAKQGKMKMSSDKSFLLITLIDGYSYEEVMNDNNRGYKPLTRSSFKEQTIMLDMSDFKMTRTDETLFKDNHQMMNISQLSSELDTLKRDQFKHRDALNLQIERNINLGSDSVYDAKKDTLKILGNSTNLLANLDSAARSHVLENAINLARNNESYSAVSKESAKNYVENTNRYKIEWHKKFTFSIACLVLFFIGAPLGAIIKKGGIGLPAVISVCFFLVFHVLTITGEKSAKEGVWEAWYGAWMATIVLLPIGIFLTYKATRDSALFEIDSYILPFKKLFGKKNADTSTLQ